MRTARSVNVVPCIPVVSGFPPERLQSRAVGMGQKPPPLAVVACANLGRGEQTPFRIEPEVGKVGEDMGEPVLDHSPDVLQEDEARSNLTEDSDNLGPEPSVIVKSTLRPGGAERLAGETGSDEIHSTAPRATVEGGKVIPDRRAIQGLVFHPRHENGRRVGVPLNETNGSVLHPCGPESDGEASIPGT